MKHPQQNNTPPQLASRLLIGLLLLLCGNMTSAAEEPLTRIAFGSCNRAEKAQPVWPAVLQFRPQLWIWSGDIIYADTTDMVRMAHLYQQQKTQPDYQKLLACCRVIGTWDDHDYGRNDGGRDYPRKIDSQRLLLDFSMSRPAVVGVARRASMPATCRDRPVSASR